MIINDVKPTFAPPLPNDIAVLDYSILDNKWSNDTNLNQKYRVGQQYKLSTDTPFCIIELIIESVFDYIKQKQLTPGEKIIIENHREIILITLKNLHDLKISVDFKELLCIIDGVTYTNGKQLYRKDSR